MTVEGDTAGRLDAAIDAILRDDAYLGAVGTEEELLDTARLLRDALPRFHPRFGFEELLARRLAVSGRGAAGTSAGGQTSLGQAQALSEPILLPTAVAVTSGAAAVGTSRRRPGLVVGGAIASGVSIAIPLAGAALVIWRRRSTGGLL